MSYWDKYRSDDPRRIPPLEALALGCYFAELTETVTAPEVPAGALLPHLLNGLYALSALQKPPALVKPAFEIKLLCLAGYEPLADSCAYCGRPDPEQPLLDVVQGILRCRSCGAKESALSMPLCPDSLAALRHIVYGDPKRLFSFRLDVPSQKKMSDVCEAFLLTQLERGFRTLPPKPLSPPSWSGDSGRWNFTRASSRRKSCRNKIHFVFLLLIYTKRSGI